MPRPYLQDLACIHDVGFSGYALGAAPGLLAILRRCGIRQGLVVDLGCGSGRWAAELTRAGYEAFGVDQSPAMIRLARRNAPHAKFQVGTLHSANLPPCDAVTAVGECVNYESGANGGTMVLQRLARRVWHALRPGGVFLFDAATLARVPPVVPWKTWTEGAGWAVLMEGDANRQRTTLIRRIICFRRVGASYRRSEETHRLRLFPAEWIVEALTGAGFDVDLFSAYGKFQLPPGIVAFLARKPRRPMLP